MTKSELLLARRRVYEQITQAGMIVTGVIAGMTVLISLGIVESDGDRARTALILALPVAVAAVATMVAALLLRRYNRDCRAHGLRPGD